MNIYCAHVAEKGKPLGGSKILNIGLFKMQPKIVVVLVAKVAKVLGVGLDCVLTEWDRVVIFECFGQLVAQ